MMRLRRLILFGALAAILALLPSRMIDAQDVARQLEVRGRVDDTNYPVVRAKVVVSDGSGVPTIDLGPAGFEIRNERGDKVADVQVSPALAEAVCLVLAVDISVSRANAGYLEGVKRAARNLLATLDGEDRLAIIAFNETVEVRQELTSDRAALARAIDGLQPITNTTQLNQAVGWGLKLLRSQDDCGARGVVAITESGQIGQPAVEASAVVEAARRHKIPVEVITQGRFFRPGDQRAIDLLSRLEEGTPGPRDLADFVTQLTRAYDVTFLADGRADGKDRRFTIALTGAGSAPVELTFTAKPRDLDATLRGVSEGDVLSGTVTLIADARNAAPGGVVGAEFRLDGQLIGTTGAPAELAWDTTTPAWPAGAYDLAATVQDSAGNTGTTTKTVQLPATPSITLTVRPDPIVIGQPAIVTVTNTSTATLQWIELRVGDKTVASSAEPIGAAQAYTFVPESGSTRPGENTITARVWSDAARQGAASATVRFVSHPPGWLMPLIIAGVLAMGLLVAALLTLNALEARRVRRFDVLVRNTGNATTRFALDARVPGDAVTCAFGISGVPLAKEPDGDRVVVITPEITPGADLKLTLSARHRSRVPRGTHEVEVVSFPVEHPEPLADGTATYQSKLIEVVF